MARLLLGTLLVAVGGLVMGINAVRVLRAYRSQPRKPAANTGPEGLF